jgi:glycosyltransferase involved in cell wall biosynthesis
MRIAVDGRTIIRGKSGVGTYVERTIRALLHIDRKNEYFLFLVEPLDGLEVPNLHKILIAGYQKAGRNRYWENFLLPVFLEEHLIDIYFGAAYALPLLPRLAGFVRTLPLPSRWKLPFNTTGRVKYIAGILDVIGFVRPETFTPKMRMWQHIFVANAVKIADSIITISESTKRDLLTLYPYDASRIHVTPLSVDEEFKPKHTTAAVLRVRERYSLPKQFILYVGTIEPRKNVAGIARAFSRLTPQLRHRYPLVIAGAKGWYADSILEQIHSLGISEDIRLVGFVDAEDLAPLIALAKLFVFPSLYEGFGYPPLEAMASGVPVITSTTSSLPEVVGDAGILVDPTDHENMSIAMKRVLTDKKLHASLQRRGLRRAKTFSWKRTAEETLAVFTATFAGHRTP